MAESYKYGSWDTQNLKKLTQNTENQILEKLTTKNCGSQEKNFPLDLTPIAYICNIIHHVTSIPQP
jgi:hypothetical protein